MEQTRTDRVPVTLLVGFLGSGKTTLANRILSEQHNERMAVIVNEFGDAGIDGSLIVNVKDNVIELSNGCLCCTVQDDLAATLHALLKRRRDAVGEKPFERILIEASGLASPGPAVQTVLVDPVLIGCRASGARAGCQHEVPRVSLLARRSEAGLSAVEGCQRFLRQTAYV